MIFRDGKIGKIYNIGGHNEKSNLEVVKIILVQVCKAESLITFVGDRRGHDLRYAIDSTKIHNELGWLSTTAFRYGLKKKTDWYLENESWWQNFISGEY